MLLSVVAQSQGMTMSLSPHFTLEEMTVSPDAVRHGLDNTPPPSVMPALERTAQGLERVRAALANPIIVTSGYRSSAVNALAKGSPNSQHMRGEAADFICPRYGTPVDVAEFLADRLDQFQIDQLILEFGHWVHISFAAMPRHMALSIDRNGDQPRTRPGIIA
jgi:hypothetical protein